MQDTVKKADCLNPKGSKCGKTGIIMLIVGVIILIGIITFLVYTVFSSTRGESSWSAVFLTNGRTYFGHVSRQTSDTLVLKDVYYLQVQQLAPQEEGGEPQPQLSIMSIVDELHSPENEMQINRNHVLFIEKLKKDSQVVTTIEQMAEK